MNLRFFFLHLTFNSYWVNESNDPQSVSSRANTPQSSRIRRCPGCWWTWSLLCPGCACWACRWSSWNTENKVPSPSSPWSPPPEQEQGRQGQQNKHTSTEQPRHTASSVLTEMVCRDDWWLSYWCNWSVPTCSTVSGVEISSPLRIMDRWVRTSASWSEFSPRRSDVRLRAAGTTQNSSPEISDWNKLLRLYPGVVYLFNHAGKFCRVSSCFWSSQLGPAEPQEGSQWLHVALIAF